MLGTEKTAAQPGGRHSTPGTEEKHNDCSFVYCGTLQVHQIANCLETGVFEALEKKYLRAVVIAFQHGSTPDAPLLEAYTLKFHYSSEGEVSMILSDLDDDSTQRKSTKQRAEAVVRR